MENKVHPIRLIMGVMFGIISVIECIYFGIVCIGTGSKFGIALSAVSAILYTNDVLSVMWKKYRIKARYAESKFFVIPVFEIMVLWVNTFVMWWMDWILISSLFKVTSGFTGEFAELILGIANMVIIPLTLVIINTIVIIVSKCMLLKKRRIIHNA